MRAGSARKMLLLFALYLAEGLPFGFQSNALPAYLRANGVSLVGIGFVGVLSVPWILKPLWAPLVDRYGRKKTWILPLQAALAICCALAALLPPDRGLFALLALVLAMNLFAASQDIAIDAWAIDMLEEDELGGGNAVQVVGYKFGMLTGGGFLVYASAWIGWHGLFLAMAALVLAVLVVTAFSREAPRARAARPEGEKTSLTARVKMLFLARESRWLLLFVATYKIGESMLDAMFKPYLVDHGFTPETIGLWIGTYGMIASLSGSIAGGWLATRFTMLRAVGIAASLRVLPMIGVVAIALSAPTPERVIALTCFEHFFAGAVTTAMFAFMMSLVDREIGATHYALLASLEVLGKSPGPWLSGPIAQSFGYAAAFAAGTTLSVLFLFTLIPLARSRSHSRPGPGDAAPP